MSYFDSPFIHSIYAQSQSGGLRAVNNASGVWTNTGAQILRVPENGFKMQFVPTRVPQNWKHGTRSQLPYINGRRMMSWSMTGLPVAPSGTAGTVPDTDILWASAFQANSGSGNVIYTTGETYPTPFALFDFVHGETTPTNAYGFGCIVTDVEIVFNGNLITATFRGMGVSRCDSEAFSGTDDTVTKGGLTTFPVEPGSASVLGTLIPGFITNTFTIGGTAMPFMCDGFTFRYSTGWSLKGDFIDDPYPAQIVGSSYRACSASITFANNDSSALNTVKNNAKANIAQSVVLIVGAVAGTQMGVTLNNAMFSVVEYNDGSGVLNAEFRDNLAHVTAPLTVGEASVTFS
jgi:hypothetical protein